MRTAPSFCDVFQGCNEGLRPSDTAPHLCDFPAEPDALVDHALIHIVVDHANMLGGLGRLGRIELRELGSYVPRHPQTIMLLPQPVCAA